VVENGYSYVWRFQNGGAPTRYVYLLDREAAARPGNDTHALPDDILLESMKAHFDDFTVVPVDTFLAQQKPFLVVDAPQNLWSETRLLRNPNYRVTVLGRISDSPMQESMLLVEQEAAPAREP
jgi:hypothetical protein